MVGGSSEWILFVTCLLHGVADWATLLNVADELRCPKRLDPCSAEWWDAVDACVLEAIQVARVAPHARHSKPQVATGDSLMGDVHANKVSVYAACQRLVDNKRNLSWAEVDAALPISLGKYTVHQKSWARRHLTMILAVFLHELKLPKRHKDSGELRGPPPTKADWTFAWRHYDNQQEGAMTFIGCDYDNVVGKLLPRLGDSSLIDFISFVRDARGSFASRLDPDYYRSPTLGGASQPATRKGEKKAGPHGDATCSGAAQLVVKTKDKAIKKCSWPRCRNSAASPRAKFCSGCFKKSARSSGSRRKVFGGGRRSPRVNNVPSATSADASAENTPLAGLETQMKLQKTRRARPVSVSSSRRPSNACYKRCRQTKQWHTS